MKLNSLGVSSTFLAAVIYFQIDTDSIAKVLMRHHIIADDRVSGAGEVVLLWMLTCSTM